MGFAVAPWSRKRDHFQVTFGAQPHKQADVLAERRCNKNSKKIAGYTNFGTQICKICGPSFGPRKWAWFSIPSLVVVPFLGPCNGLVSGSKIEPQSTPVSRALAMGAILSETIGGERQEASKTHRVVISCCPLWPRKWDYKVNGLQWRRGPENGTIFRSLLGPSRTSKPTLLQNAGATKIAKNRRVHEF